MQFVTNLTLWCGPFPRFIRLTRTTFIPKAGTAMPPQDFHPISVPPVLVRQLNAILTTRLTSSVDWDPRQRCFLPTDGCADKATIVDLVLRSSHKSYRSCHIANLDVRKAFDSLSHASIYNTLKACGARKDFVDYVQSSYEVGGNCLCGEGWRSVEFVPARGVKQGDLLSPILFNLIINRLLSRGPNAKGPGIFIWSSTARLLHTYQPDLAAQQPVSVRPVPTTVQKSLSQSTPTTSNISR